MFSRQIIKLAVLIGIIFFSCGKDESNPTELNNDTNEINKSNKRGIAYNLTDPLDLDSLKNGVSWWYNWHFRTNAPSNYYEDYQMEYIPMLWGGNKENDFTEVKQLILGHPEIKYLLVLNEPNLTDQANQTPFEAATNWVKYESLVEQLEKEGREIYLVGPAMNWGTMTNYWDPVEWLDTFYDSYRYINDNEDPRIDYLAFHWYDYGLEAQLDRLQKYGKQIWITELANWNQQINSYAKQAEQMKEMVSVCESREDVFRYAWFIGRGNLPDNKYTYLFEPNPGQLNDLGRLYLSLPFKN
ncbi:MAG: hypothetical protein JEY94_03555 [Melioribacteraceae bacterium]|nr:hypothetical protein [Melioribacteraceae bacterium]